MHATKIDGDGNFQIKKWIQEWIMGKNSSNKTKQEHRKRRGQINLIR